MRPLLVVYCAMSKAFTKEDDQDEVVVSPRRFSPLPAGFRNLITPSGANLFKQELDNVLASLMTLEKQVTWDGTLDRETHRARMQRKVVGIDEVRPEEGRISWASPIGRA